MGLELQNFMEERWMEQTGQDREDLNCQELVLCKDDILKLENLVQNEELPDCEDGFFYGIENQDQKAKEYKQYDLKFCDWALDELTDEKVVYFSCWW